jgi:hypothetical protein
MAGRSATSEPCQSFSLAPSVDFRMLIIEDLLADAPGLLPVYTSRHILEWVKE